MTSVLLLGLLIAATGPTAESVGPDAIPWVDLDAVHKQTVSTRERWLFRPRAGSEAAAQEGLGGAETVAILSRYDDLWILEAPTANVDDVEALWAPLGNLRRDENGSPALNQTTRLVGANNIVWDGLGLRGNYVGSVAILDSGCDSAHDDLGDPTVDNVDLPPGAAGDPTDWWDADTHEGYPGDGEFRIVGWHDVSDDMPGARGPYDYHFHGTALAGVAFGGGDVDDDFTGVAPDGRFVVVKTFNFEGQWQTWASDFLLGVEWVLNHAATYNIQAVLVGTVWETDLELTAAVQALADEGIAVIAPVGNDPGASIGYPARVDAAIAVGATDEAGFVAAYSTPASDFPWRLDLMAPGGSRLGENGGVDACDNEPNDTYRARTGTSLAAAHVAGAVSLVQQVMVESGMPWRRDAAQVRWLESLLTITAVETFGAEPGAVRPPPRSRFGADAIEGHGLLQIPAAVDAVRNVLWPGDSQFFFLDAPTEGRAVWGARFPTSGHGQLRFELFPPPEADYDLFAYRESPDGFLMVALSVADGLGQAERIDLVDREPGWVIVVAKRVVGSGLAQVVSSHQFAPGHRWPVQLSSHLVVAPVVHDLTGDQVPEVIVTNNVAVDATGHTFYVFDKNGVPLPPFPRTFFSALPGVLSAPAVADLGTGPLMFTGSSFGQIYGVDATGVRVVSTQIATGPTTAAVIANPGPSARVIAGTRDGISLLDRDGTVVDQWALPGGVLNDPALGDLDGDQDVDVVALEDGVAVHARNLDGTPIAGWPIALASTSTYSAPVILGDFAGEHRVAWIERTPSPTVLLHLVGADGVASPGFPRTFDQAAGGRTELPSLPIASRLVRGGPVHILSAAWHTDATGEIDLRVHDFTLAGAQSVLASIPMGGPRLGDGLFQLTRRRVATLRVLDIASAPGAEIWLGGQLAWSETFLGSARRYGSSHPNTIISSSGPDPRRQWQLRSGHLAAPPGAVVPVTVADLDGDNFPEILVARDTRVHLMTAPVPSASTEYWGEDRGGGARQACYGCAPDPVVAVQPRPLPARLALRAAPNPFNPRTSLWLDAPVAGTAEWRVVDARGREVSAWTQVVDAPGRVESVWNGTDRRGAALASGVYFVSVRLGRSSSAAAVSLVR